MAYQESSFELPSSFDELPPVGGGLTRMSDDFEAFTPRPGAQAVACFVPPPPKIRRCLVPQGRDSTTYRFATIHDFEITFGKLHCLVKTKKDISEEDFRLLRSALEKNFIKMIVRPRKTVSDHRHLIDETGKQLLEIQRTLSSLSNPEQIEELEKTQREKQAFLTDLKELKIPSTEIILKDPRTGRLNVIKIDPAVPHHVIIHPASLRKFRDVLNSTSDRMYASTNSLMKQVSEDIRQFLTAPEKLENRQRVLQQIRDDRRRVIKQIRDDRRRVLQQIGDDMS